MSPLSTQLDSVIALGGFASGLVVTGSYLLLAIRNARYAQGNRWHLLVGVGSFLWCVGALWSEAVGCSLVGSSPHTMGLAFAVKVLATGGWITAGLAIWETFPNPAASPRITRALQIGAVVISVSLAVLGIVGFAKHDLALVAWGGTAMRIYILVYSIALIAYGSGLLLQARPLPRPARFSTLLMLVGFAGLVVGTLGRTWFYDVAWLHRPIEILHKQSPLIVILGSLFLFAQFRHAELFIRFSLRIALANAVGVSVVTVLVSLLPRSDYLDTLGVPTLFAASLAIACAASFYHQWATELRRFIDEWVFRSPDYRDSLEQFRQRLQTLALEGEMMAASHSVLKEMLECERCELITAEKLPDAVRQRLAQGETVEGTRPEFHGCRASAHCTEWTFPVHCDGRLTHGLSVHISEVRRILVSQEIAFAHAIAVALGHRMSALQRERELVERKSRETRLLQQVTEAELRALRAQLNPHFLFNAFNTVADLIVTDPSRAEMMTLRLAQVFRHLLAHSSRSLTSIEEEMGFVKKYLYIEEARFGDRLRVDISIAPGVQQHRVPSLILQPLVENALKHGLGPKPGVVNIWIRAVAAGPCLQLVVEDDGVGIPGMTAGTTWAPENIRPLSPRGAGVGLRNVAERLQALYEKRANFVLEKREEGGSRVTLTLPLDAPLAA